MKLVVYRRALEAVRRAHPLFQRVRRYDRNLHDQARRAATSIVLNIAEAEYSDGGNRKSRFHTAAGSANELSAALHLAEAYQYVSEDQIAPLLIELDRIRAMLWALSHR